MNLFAELLTAHLELTQTSCLLHLPYWLVQSAELLVVGASITAYKPSFEPRKQQVLSETRYF
jgi:hypothetical protein